MSSNMGFYVSKKVALVALLAAVAAVVTIIILSVRCSLGKSKSEVAPTSTPATIPAEEPWDRYRLPDALAPVSYNVTLWPRLVPNPDGLYVFTGHSSVVFTCVKETDLILIHSNKLNLTTFGGHQAKLIGLGGVAAPTLRRTWLEVPTQYLVIQLSGPLEVGRSYELFTEFIGELGDMDMGGFYRSEYMEEGDKKVVATTQMQPTDARKAFPCFDEPAMKATFHMTLIHPHGTVALANAMNYKPVNITKGDQGVIQTSFAPTEVMSSYLLAFVVCDFGFIGTPPGTDVMIRIWARRGLIEKGDAQYALEKTGSILAFFERYYNSSYPMIKSDQIAVPTFPYGAMENWGLITYTEGNLLYNPATSTNEDKETVLETICHELAHMDLHYLYREESERIWLRYPQRFLYHPIDMIGWLEKLTDAQWFGNLVTMKWWNDAWLNEAFATYVSNLGTNFAEPTWKMTELFVQKLHGVMTVDALGYYAPLSVKEEEIAKPYQIQSRFNSATYNKGALVLRMLSEFISEDLFSKGLSTYLNQFKYRNTVPADLWKNLQMAVDSASPSLGLPYSVEVIMNCWILQSGFPVVTIDTRTGSIRQDHFRYSNDTVSRHSEFNYKWFIPVTWMKTGTVQERYWLLNEEDTNTHMRANSNEWVLANININGFYRVNYDSANWDLLLAQLDANHQEIPVINRAQIIDDVFNLKRANIVNITLALSTSKYLNKETEYLPWKTAKEHLDKFLFMFGCSDIYGSIQGYVKKQVTPLFNHLKHITTNWTKVPDHTDQYNQVIAISLACSTGVEGCEELTLGWYREWMKNPTKNPIHPNLRSTVYCSAIAAGGTVEWDFGWSVYKNATIATEADTLRLALTCTRQPQLLKKYLDYCLDPEMVQKHDAPGAIGSIARNVIGQSLAWDFVQANLSRIIAYTGERYWFTSLLKSVTKRFSSEMEYKQVQQLGVAGLAGGDIPAGTLHLVLSEIKNNIKWMAMHKDQVSQWFSSSAN